MLITFIYFTMEAISFSGQNRLRLNVLRLCLIFVFACFFSVYAQPDRSVARRYSNSLFADANHLGVNFLDSYYQLTTVNVGVDRLRRVKNWRLGVSYGLTVSHLQRSSETLLGVNCTFTALADVHFIAKLGLSVNPVHLSPQQKDGDSNMLLFYPIVTFGYRYPIVKDKVGCTVSLGTCGVGAGIAVTLNDKK